MKKALFLFLCLWLSSNFAVAYNLKVSYKGLYYGLNYSDHTCIATWGTRPSSGSNTYNSYCSGAIVIPNSIVYEGETYDVTAIDEYAFYNQKITSVVIGKNVKSIGNYAFKAYSSANILTEVRFPENLESIGQEAFNGQPIKSVILPASVSSIGRSAFSSCKSLTSVVLPAKLKTISESMFSGCTLLETVTFTEGIETIGNYAFASCSSLADITFPESLKSIGLQAFHNAGVTSITLPTNVKSIGARAFNGCPVSDVYCWAEEPPVLDSNVFTNFPSVHVYAYLEPLYASNESWMYFYVDTEWPNPNCENPVISYKDGQLFFECNTPGAEFYYTITPEVTGRTKQTNAVIPFAPMYTITCFATAPDHAPSGKTTLTIPIPFGINGDMNHDGRRSVEDVSRLVDAICSGE